MCTCTPACTLAGLSHCQCARSLALHCWLCAPSVSTLPVPQSSCSLRRHFAPPVCSSRRHSKSVCASPALRRNFASPVCPFVRALQVSMHCAGTPRYFQYAFRRLFASSVCTSLALQIVRRHSQQRYALQTVRRHFKTFAGTSSPAGTSRPYESLPALYVRMNLRRHLATPTCTQYALQPAPHNRKNLRRHITSV